MMGRVLRSLKVPANKALGKMMQLGIGSSLGIVKVTNSLAPNPDGPQVFWNPPYRSSNVPVDKAVTQISSKCSGTPIRVRQT